MSNQTPFCFFFPLSSLTHTTQTQAQHRPTPTNTVATTHNRCVVPTNRKVCRPHKQEGVSSHKKSSQVVPTNRKVCRTTNPPRSSPQTGRCVEPSRKPAPVSAETRASARSVGSLEWCVKRHKCHTGGCKIPLLRLSPLLSSTRTASRHQTYHKKFERTDIMFLKNCSRTIGFCVLAQSTENDL